MQLLKSKSLVWALVVGSVAFYLLSMVIVKIDTDFDYRWPAFWLHIASVFIIFCAYALRNLRRLRPGKISLNEIGPVLVILMISVLVNFWLLSTYPYVSISDELRDGGLYAMDIASGTLKNIFAYGSYNGHGLIIPIFSGFFYHVFGSSLLTFRFPSALLSSLDVVLIYLLIRTVINKQTAFWSALILLTFPLHIFFAHTQIVVAFNFFWVPVILLPLYILLKKHRFIDYIFLGTILGFALGFHAAIRGFAGLIILILLFLDFKDIIFAKLGEEKIRIRLSKMALLLFFALVGFGPRIFFTGPEEFFLSGSSAFKDKVETPAPFTLDGLTKIKNNYTKSLMVYIYEPTTFFYSEHKPIFPPLMAFFFVLGIGYSLFVLKNKFLNILLFIILAIPLTNSAITDWVNADHRLTPILSISAIFAAIGISFCLGLIKNRYGKYLFGGLVALFLSWQVITFYTTQSANKNYELKDYLSMQALYFLQADREFQAPPAQKLEFANSTRKRAPICLFVSPTNYMYMNNNIGIQEQQRYLLPNADINFAQENSINDNEVYIVKKSCLNSNKFTASGLTSVITCGSKNKFACPLNYRGSMIIHY